LRDRGIVRACALGEDVRSPHRELSSGNRQREAMDVRLISRVPRRASTLLTAFETAALEMFNLTAARAKECHSATFAKIASLLDQAMPDFTGLIRATINFVEDIPRFRDGIDI
jgi:hypothetical protein